MLHHARHGVEPFRLRTRTSLHSPGGIPGILISPADQRRCVGSLSPGFFPVRSYADAPRGTQGFGAKRVPIVTRSPMNRRARVCTALLVPAHDPRPSVLPHAGGDTGAYPQASSLVAGGDGPNKKTDLRFLLYSTIPGSVNECYGNRHFFFSRPAGGTLSSLCAEGAAPQFFQGTCSIFSRPMQEAYPPVFLRGDELCDDSLKGGAFRWGAIFDAPGPPSCAAAPSPRHALHTTPRPGDRPRPGPGPAAPRPPGHLLPLPICPQRAHTGPIYTRSRPSAPVPFRKLYTSSKVYNKKSRIIDITRYSVMNRRRVPPEA